MKTNKLKYLTITAVFFLIGNMNALANGITPPEPDATPDPLPGEAAPIDQTIIWLLIIGVFAAFYFLRTKKIAKVEK